MLATFRATHAGLPIAVLGSGPSLASFRGREPIAIAVNGAATSDVPYQYFVCGDAASPSHEWFYASQRHRARRLIASFLTPYDAILFPRRRDRWRLRLARLPYSRAARRQGELDPLYAYTPRLAPAPGHGWFRYARRYFPVMESEYHARARHDRLMHGASIAGVAVQLALAMGAAAIHVYGCSMDNDAGGNYYRPGSHGRTTPLQRTNFATLLGWIERSGVEVVRHDT